MLHSANLNVIIKSLEKVSSRLARDFVELENLQNNNFSAIKFANSCYKRIEETLIFELKKVRPNYNIQLVDGRKIINNPNSEYQYIICPIDGLFNLSRSITSFSSFVALQYSSPDGKKEIISTVILNVLANEIYICEKGSGVFLNNRKVRASKRDFKDGIICSLNSYNSIGQLMLNPMVKFLQEKKVIFQISNCSSLDLAYFAVGKVDLCIFDIADKNFLNSVFLLAKEAGAELIERDGLIVVGNEKIKFEIN